MCPFLRRTSTSATLTLHPTPVSSLPRRSSNPSWEGISEGPLVPGLLWSPSRITTVKPVTECPDVPSKQRTSVEQTLVNKGVGVFRRWSLVSTHSQGCEDDESGGACVLRSRRDGRRRGSHDGTSSEWKRTFSSRRTHAETTNGGCFRCVFSVPYPRLNSCQSRDSAHDRGSGGSLT